MSRRAERRAQATAEWIAVVIAVSAALAGIAWFGAPQVPAVAAALAPGQQQTALADQQLVDAVAGRPGALSPLGADAWLHDDDPATAQARLNAATALVMQARHPGWGRELRITGAPIRGTRRVAAVRTTGALQARVATFADERAGTHEPTLADRAGAAGTNLAWQAAGSLARRVARPLGLAVSAVQLAAGLVSGDDALPAGVRAGDVIVCRAVVIDLRGGPIPRATRVAGWRAGVLRDGQLILDAVTAENPCAAPAGA